MADDYHEALATTFYYDRNFETDAAKVLPGEYFFTNKDMLLVTVLGSCVAACIRDQKSGIGGMNHFMLPDSRVDESSQSSGSARYGSYAMEILINDITKNGGAARKPRGQGVRWRQRPARNDRGERRRAQR